MNLPIVEYASEKWGREPHYRGSMFVLGEDELGLWLWGPSGRTIYRGAEPLFVTEYDVITVVPPGAWWAPAWWLGHPELDLYVNINTPAEIGEDRIVYTDLDLDVIRLVDGSCEIVDQDEFEVHQRRYGYPEEVVAATEQAAAEALQLVSERVPPFDGTAATRWTHRARETAPRRLRSPLP